MKKFIFEKEMLCRLMKLYERYFSFFRRILKGKYILLIGLEIVKTEFFK